MSEKKEETDHQFDTKERIDQISTKENKDIKLIIISSILVKCVFLLYCFCVNDPFNDAHKEGFNFEARYNPKKYWWTNKMSFLINWDGLYFFNAAQQGYSNLRQFAFYPGFPIVLKYLDSFFKKAVPLYSSFTTEYGLESISIMIIGLLLNFTLHLLNNYWIYKIARLRGCALGEAKMIGLLFAISATSLYHVTLYSESLYLSLCLYPLLRLEQDIYLPRKSLSAAPWTQFFIITGLLAFSGLVRSVGILNFAYIGYPLFIELLSPNRPGGQTEERGTLRVNRFQSLLRLIVSLVMFVFPTFWLFLRTRELFCREGTEIDQGYVQPEFCLSSFGFFYNYIQEKYWGVRFLGQLRDGGFYYHFLSLNFLPVLYHFFRTFFQRNKVADILTLNVRLIREGVDISDRRFRDFSEFCIVVITSRMFYFYANQNSVERFWASYYFSYFIQKEFQLSYNSKKDPSIVEKFFRRLILGNIIVRLIITPFLFVTNLHPV